MITYSGIHVTPYTSGSPNERDLAVAMCRITRYAGALWCPLAAHSILVAEFCAMKHGNDVLWAHGLLHDAHECVTGEVTRWWKPSAMKENEHTLDARILEYFNLNVSRHLEGAAMIKEADEKALCAEATLLELPGWPDFYRRESGRDIPALSDSERAVAAQILRGLWRRPEMVSGGSPQVITLHKAFQKVRLGHYGDARKLLSPICFAD